MVSSLLLLKLLQQREHDKKVKKRSKISLKHFYEGTKSHYGEPMVKITIKRESTDSLYTCRICLNSGVIPIFGGEHTDDLSEDINTISGLNIQYDDAYPMYLCDACYSLLQGAILFRKTAQQSDEILHCSEEDINNHDDNLVNNDGNEASYIEEKKPSIRNIFHCKRCDLKFDTLKSYQDHTMSDEHENKRETCTVCNKSYRARYIKKHMAIHRLDSFHICDICGKKFTIQGQFARHRLTHFYHLPFKCSLCPYRGRFSESLKMHMRSHTGDKPYTCEHCPGRSFINKSNLNKHMLTHKGTLDYTCETCGRGFHSKREMEQHFKVDHTGIKEHICNICGKAFGYRNQMMKHQLKVHKRAKLKIGRIPLYLQVDAKKAKEQMNDIEMQRARHENVNPQEEMNNIEMHTVGQGIVNPQEEMNNIEMHRAGQDIDNPLLLHC